MNTAPSPANPLIQVLKLLMADPQLRRTFIADPALVFKQLGLGCPADFVGRRGNHCPVMPPLPAGEAARDISHPYWQEWLAGSLEQLRNARVVLRDETPFPHRDSFSTEAEWHTFVEEVRQMIKNSIKNWQNTDRVTEQHGSIAAAGHQESSSSMAP